MIPGPFHYHRPTTLSDAVGLMASLSGDIRALAGGHSLIPMMKLRMATPEHLVDLAGIADLRGISEESGRIVIGATTTQAALIGSELLAHRLPILRQTALQIADPQIRSKGTIGGNVANGDPGNDMPAVMQCLDATFVLRGPDGPREVPARAFYLGIYETALRPGEILTNLSITPPPPGHGYAYEKLKRKIGDYATAAAAVILTLDAGRVATASITLTNVGPTPLLVQAAMDLVIGSTLDAATLKQAAAAAQAIADPATDGRGTADYRRAMAGVMVTRALKKAAEGVH
jgi:carbon-monoxide dehydrogenase medium subunit